MRGRHTGRHRELLSNFGLLCMQGSCTHQASINTRSNNKTATLTAQLSKEKHSSKDAEVRHDVF